MKLSKTYEPRAYEAEIYDLWLASKAFAPRSKDESEGEPFALIMPPPNANAKLHIGQATYVKQDVKSRYRRLRGDRVLYLPGADHAGFETWYMYERRLAEQGKSRFDFTDRELYAQTYDFVMENIHLAKLVYRQLGLSCSWDHFTFTLDEKIVRGVNSSFKKMWEDGLIYRGKRLVNYCTKHLTGFSDIEVEYEDRETPLYYVKYGPFEVATTRPETMLGDVAVAVHPEDKRYLSLVGKDVEVEALKVLGAQNLAVKVVADEELVDVGFGTGVVKVTPAHDFNDWDVAQRHDLPIVEVIGKDGKMNENAGRFAALSVMEAREAVVKILQENDLLIKIDENYKNRVGVCYKCQTVIEPLLMEQWFIRMRPLAEKAIEAIEADKIKFRPANRKQIGLDFLSNIRDWNISRQIPWGIRIPAFYNEEFDEWVYSEADDDVIVRDGKEYVRDSDVFDTWMSSTQFPYLALGYDVENPENSSEEFKEFFPTAWLQHGREIFNFWGLRMIMMALYNTGEVPFKTLYVNGNIRGEDGRKMSKSLNNNISAEDILDEYGSDAMRMGLISIDNSAGSDKAFDRSKMVLGRNFANKLWNVARFVENLLDESGSRASDLDEVEAKSEADHWILSELSKAADRTAELLDEDEFGEAFNVVYDATWNKLADWYIEASKKELNLSVLVGALETILRLAHVFAPFVTETIWQSLQLRGENSLLVTESWPEKVEFNSEKAQEFENVTKATEFARKVKAYIGNEIEVSFSAKASKDKSHKNDGLAEMVSGLAKLTSSPRLRSTEGKTTGNFTESLSVPGLDGWSLMISSENLAKYRDEIGKRIDALQAQIKNLEARLNNSAYVEKAPEELVRESEETLAKLKEELKGLKGE